MLGVDDPIVQEKLLQLDPESWIVPTWSLWHPGLGSLFAVLFGWRG